MVVDKVVRNGRIWDVWEVESTEFANGTDY